MVYYIAGATDGFSRSMPPESLLAATGAIVANNGIVEVGPIRDFGTFTSTAIAPGHTMWTGTADRMFIYDSFFKTSILGMFYNVSIQVEYHDYSSPQATDTRAFLNASQVPAVFFAGADLFQGGYLDDTMNGYGGNDTIVGGEGTDNLNGGDGDDWIWGESLQPPGYAFYNAYSDTITGGGGRDVIDAGYGNDIVYGGADGDLISGGDHTDALSGDGGNDVIYGDKDHDYIDGGEGADILTGGGGNDVVWGGLGGDAISGDANSDVLSGHAGDDVIWGDSPNDDPSLQGDDTINGDEGADTIYGFGGPDNLWGGTGGDSIHGGDGNDSLRGMSGNDYLYGDAGADTFLYDETGFGQDQIFDFEHLSDRLLISSSIFASASAALAHSAASGGHTFIDAGGGNIIVLMNFTSLTAGDIQIF